VATRSIISRLSDIVEAIERIRDVVADSPLEQACRAELDAAWGQGA
jgi:hypothetical protein